LISILDFPIIVHRVTQHVSCGEHGDFIKMKARLVALGNHQDKEDYISTSSPTVSSETIMPILGIAASRRWKVASIYVTGAYLEANVPDANPV
jgi:hypothetical protein